MSKNILYRALLLVMIISLVYIGSYVSLSAYGQYEPASIGLGHVMAYGWAPKGFYNTKWNHKLICIYYPLYVLDITLWHNEVR